MKVANQRHPHLLLWRFDRAILVQGFRDTFAGITDVLLLVALLVGTFFGLAFAIRYAATEQIPREAVWLILLGWPLSYVMTRAARRRLRWFEECTPFSAVALQSSTQRAYLSVPWSIGAGLFLTAVLIAAQNSGSMIVVGALASLCLVAGGVQSLAPASPNAAEHSPRHRAALPPCHGWLLLVLAVMRSQTFGLPPRVLLLIGLGVVLFCLPAAAFVLGHVPRASIEAAAVTAITLICFTRPDFHLSRCAPKNGFGPGAVIVAHTVLPTGIALIATAGVFAVAGFDLLFLALAWATWAAFCSLTILRALRYPRYSMQGAELRLLLDIVVLAVVGTAFLPLIIPALVIIIGQAVIAHRRVMWKWD